MKDKIMEFLKGKDWKKIALYADFIGAPLSVICMFSVSFLFGILFAGISAAGCVGYFLEKHTNK